MVTTSPAQPASTYRPDKFVGAYLLDSSGKIINPLGSSVSSGTATTALSSASSAQVVALNLSRKGLVLTNTDANTVYVKCGTTASLTDFTVAIPPGGTWVMDQPIYTGRIDAIWAADGSGSLIGTEF